MPYFSSNSQRWPVWALALGLAALAATAHADSHWNVGVQVGVPVYGYAPPPTVAPGWVSVAPGYVSGPAYYGPPTYFGPPPVFVSPGAPVYTYGPPVVYIGGGGYRGPYYGGSPGRGYGHGRGHWR